MKLATKEITYISLFVAFAIVCAFITRFTSGLPIPFSLLPFVAVLAGTLLGKRLGAYALILYLFIGLIGLPVFAAAPFGGFTYILLPSFGFLIGFIAAAYVTGLFLEKKNSYQQYVLASLSGMIVIYIIGLPYMWAIFNLYMGELTDVWTVLKWGLFPFIIKDLAFAIAAAFIAKSVKARLPFQFTSVGKR